MNRIESQHTEWKEAWHDDHLRWVCGFANAEGGRLEIGRNNKCKPNDLWIEFPFSPAYLEAIGLTAQTGPQAGPESAPNRHQGAAQVTAQLTAQVTAQVAACCKEQPQSAKAIMAALNMKHWKTFQSNYLLPLIDAGYIERTIPDKPTSRLQKYRLTERGKMMLASKS